MSKKRRKSLLSAVYIYRRSRGSIQNNDAMNKLILDIKIRKMSYPNHGESSKIVDEVMDSRNSLVKFLLSHHNIQDNRTRFTD